jgi:hypothetical protein
VQDAVPEVPGCGLNAVEGLVLTVLEPLILVDAFSSMAVNGHS